MTRLFLHVGIHKTGSTTIQRALESKKKELFNEGIIHIPVFSGMWKYKMELDEIPDQEIEKYHNNLIKVINKNKKKNKNIFVMSWEQFVGDPYKSYQDTPAIAEMMRRITDGIPTSIIMYIRRQDQFIESLYTQSVHEGGYWSFEEFIENYDLTKTFHWDDLINIYSKNFTEDSMIIRRYDKKYLPESKSILFDFSNIIGSTCLSEFKSRNQNRGYSRDALEIARICNQHLDLSQKNVLRDILQETNAKAPFENYSYLSYKDRIDLLKIYDDSNQLIQKKYFQDDENLLFSLPVNSNVEKDYSLSLEKVVLAYTRIIIKMNEKNESIMIPKFINLIISLEEIIIKIKKKLFNIKIFSKK